MDLNKELILIPADEDTQVGVGEWAGEMGEDWDLIFLPDVGIVTRNTEQDIARVNKLIAAVTFRAS